jgi:hypothetical protein
MKSQIILAAAMSALMLSPAAFAGSAKTTPSADPAAKNYVQVAAMTPAEQCTALEGQWQKESPALKSHAKYAAAEKLADQGKQLCTAGKAKDGAAKFEEALKDIGLKPKT